MKLIYVIQILDIVPHEGTIVPYSSQYACFIFHGIEPMQVKVVALCEVLQGPTELVNVTANADTVLFFVDRQVTDFDEQVSDMLIFNLSSLFRANIKLCQENYIIKLYASTYTSDLIIFFYQ